MDRLVYPGAMFHLAYRRGPYPGFPLYWPQSFPQGALPLMESYRINLSEAEMPQEWYNIIPDLPSPMPPYLHPGTGEPITPADLAALFPPALIEQEVSPERWIPIPDEGLRIYQWCRPTPRPRARN